MAEEKLVGQLKLGLNQFEKDILRANDLLKALGKDGDKNLLELKLRLNTENAKTVQNLQQTETQTKRVTVAQVQQNKELSNLIHLRKTEQINLGNYVRKLDDFRKANNFNTLSLKEQIQVVRELNKAKSDLLQFGTSSTSSMQARGFGFFDRMAVSMQYALAGMTLMQIRKSVQEIFTTIENVEKQERILVAVTGEALENVRQYTKEAMDIAKNSATSLENVTLAYERLAKAGIRKEDLKGMAEIVTRFQNIGDIQDSSKAVEYLVSIVKQMNLEFSDSSKILDVFWNVAKNTNVQVLDLGEGLEQFGSMANQLGMSLEQASALLATVAAGMGTTGSETGTALKSIISNILRNADALEMAGVKIKKSKDAYLDLETILLNIAKKINELEEQGQTIEQMDVARLVGITRRVNQVLVFSEKVDDYYQNLENAMNSAGSAAKAEEEILKSYSAQVKQVQVAFQELAISIGEAGLLDVLKKLASGGKSLTEAFTGLSPEIKSALMVALALGAAFVTLNQVIKSKLLISLSETIKALLGVKMGVMGVSASLTGVTLGISALVAGIAIWIQKTKEADQKQTELLNKQIEQKKAIKAENDELDKLISNYDTLKEKTSLTTEEKQRLHEIEVKLAEIFPQTTNGIDGQNQAFTTQIGLVKQLKDEKKEAYKEELTILANQGKMRIESLIAERDSLEEKKKKLQNEMKVNEDFVTKYSALYQKVQREIREGGVTDKTVEEIQSIKDDRYYFFHTVGFMFTMEDEMEKWKEQSQKIKEITDELEENKRLRIEYATAMVELDKIQNPQNYNMKDPFADLGDAKTEEVYVPANIYTPETLRKLLNADKISLKYYISELEKIRNEQYSLYLSKTPEELNQLLLTPEVGKEIEAYLSLVGEIKSAKERWDKENKEKDIYSAKINQFHELEEALKLANLELERNNILTNLAEEKDKIGLLSERVELLKQEQEALHNLNEARRDALEQNVDKLNALGLGATYDRATDTLEIKNRQQLNEIILANARAKGLDADKTNELLKSTEELVKETDSLSDAIDKGKNTWWQYENEIDSANKAIKKITEDQKDLVQKYIDSYFDYLNKSINKQIQAIEDLKSAMQEKVRKSVESLQEEIDKLEEENALLKEQEERQKRLDNIAKQRKLIANIEKERNVRMLINGEWQYVADPKKLKEAQDRLRDLKEDYDKWEEENNRKAEIQKLRDQIKNLQDTQKAKEKEYDNDIKTLRKYLDKQKDLLDASIEAQITTWDELIKKLNEVGVAYETELGKATKATESYYQTVGDTTNRKGLLIDDSAPSKIITNNKGQVKMNAPNGDIHWVPASLGEHYIDANWKYSKYHKGGFVGDKPLDPKHEEIAKVLRGELLTTPKQLDDAYPNMVNTVSDILLSSLVEKIPGFRTSLTPSFSMPQGFFEQEGKGDIYHQYHVRIDKVETKDANSFVEVLPTLVHQYKE